MALLWLHFQVGKEVDSIKLEFYLWLIPVLTARVFNYAAGDGFDLAEAAKDLGAWYASPYHVHLTCFL